MMNADQFNEPMTVDDFLELVNRTGKASPTAFDAMRYASLMTRARRLHEQAIAAGTNPFDAMGPGAMGPGGTTDFDMFFQVLSAFADPSDAPPESQREISEMKRLFRKLKITTAKFLAPLLAVQAAAPPGKGPSIALLKPPKSSHSKCHVCQKTEGELKAAGKPGLLRCSQCELAFFCNKDCQKAGWKKHKPECKKTTQGNVKTMKAPTKQMRDFMRGKHHEADSSPGSTSCAASDAHILAAALKEATGQTFTVENGNGSAKMDAGPPTPAPTPTPAQPARRECSHCRKCEAEVPNQKLLMCSACKIALFCSRDCQQRAWPKHKLDCKK
jgi:hypothetical protein